jgi:hypothetical protein
MFDQEIPQSQVKAGRFPFPCEGDITLAVRNKNYALGPVMLHLTMKPGSSIPAHVHKGVAEVLRELIAAPPAVGRTVLAFARAHPDSFVVC